MARKTQTHNHNQKMISRTKIKERMQKKSNPNMLDTVMLLRKQKAEFWQNIAGLLSKPKRKSIDVNLSKIEKYSDNNDIIVVPGKVLSSGELSKKITIASLSASESARKKANIISINELVKKNPKGEGLKIIM